MNIFNRVLLFSTSILIGTSAFAKVSEVKCTERESFDSITMREYNGPDSEGVLKNAKPNPGTGNIGDYTVTFDSKTKKISAITVVRKTSGIKTRFDLKNSTFRNNLVKLEPGSFEGECENCRTHFELIEGVDNSSGNRITLKIDNHGAYPDLVVSSFSFKIGTSSFDLADVYTTEMTCDETILLERPAPTESLEDDLVE